MAKYKFLKIVCDACCHVPQAHIKDRSGKGKSAGGVVFIDKLGNVVGELSFYFGELTPPQAEYNILIKALDKVSGLCRDDIEVWIDSEFIVKQLSGDYGIKSENMKPLFDEVKKLERRFNNIKYFHHSRYAKLAKQADNLAEREYKKAQG